MLKKCFTPSVHFSRNLCLFHVGLHFRYDLRHKCLPLTLADCNLVNEIIINLRLEILQRQVIQFYFNL